MATASTGGDIEKTKSVEVKKIPNVLIVDDDAVTRKVYEMLIKKLGGISQTAENGEEAVNIHRNGDVSFDLILMDKEMPKMDGVSATKKLREMKVMSMIVGVTSRAGDKEEFKAFMDAGLDLCWEKPLKRDMLEPLINKLMDVDGLSPV